jgi:hypothetical protein
MGDKSPKSKQRNQKQREATRVQDAATAKAKQDQQSYSPQIGKGKK